MTDEQRIEELRKILKPVIVWYNQIIDEGEPDSSFLYDTTYERFDDLLTRGDFQRIIEVLL